MRYIIFVILIFIGVSVNAQVFDYQLKGKLPKTTLWIMGTDTTPLSLKYGLGKWYDLNGLLSGTGDTDWWKLGTTLVPTNSDSAFRTGYTLLKGISDGGNTKIEFLKNGILQFNQDAGTARYLIRFKPLQTTAGNTDFNWAIGTFANYGSKNNDVAYFGWNMGAGGSPSTAGKSMFGLAFENYYNPSPGTNKYQEFHLLHTDSLGNARRPITFFLDNFNPLLWSGAFHVPTFEFRPPDDVDPYAKISNPSGTKSQLQLLNPVSNHGASFYVDDAATNMQITQNMGAGAELHTESFDYAIVNRLLIQNDQNTATEIAGRDATGWVSPITTGYGLDINTAVLSVDTNEVATPYDLTTITSPAPRLSSLLHANAANTIYNKDWAQTWRADSLSSGTFLSLVSNGTMAASNTQILFSASLAGANANASQSSYAGVFSNLHTGTGQVNYGLYSEASSTTANSGAAGWFKSTNAARGLLAQSVTGNGAYIYTSSTGVPMRLENTLTGTATSTIIPILQVNRFTTGTASAGTGGAIDFTTSYGAGSSARSTRLSSSWSNTATPLSSFVITGVNATEANVLTLAGTGQLTLDQYTISNFNGGVSADSVLVVTSAGVVKKRNASAFAPDYDFLAVSTGLPPNAINDAMYHGTGNVGLNTTAPDKALEINLGTTNAFRINYNDNNGSAATYKDETISSTGLTTFDAAGSAPAFNFADKTFITSSGAAATGITGTDASGYITTVTLGTGLSITSGTLDIADQSATNEIQDITVTGASQPFTVDLSGDATDMTLTGAGINVITRSTNALTITGTEVDGSTTNELQTLAKSTTATTYKETLSNSGGSFQLTSGAGVSFTPGGTTLDGTVTINVDDTDPANELQTLANTSSATTHTVTLSNSGGSVQLVEGSNVTLTTTGTGLNGIVTIAATSGAADGNGMWTASNDNTNIANADFQVGVSGVLEFRDGSEHDLYIDAAADRIGMGTNIPGADLDISGAQGSMILQPNAAGGTSTMTLKGKTDGAGSVQQQTGINMNYIDADYASGVEQVAAQVIMRKESDLAQWTTYQVVMPENTDADVFVAEKQALFSNNTTESHVAINAGIAFTQNYEWTVTAANLFLDRSYNIVNVSGSGAISDEVRLPEVASTSDNWDPALTETQVQVGQEYTITNFRAATNLVIRTFTGDEINAAASVIKTLLPTESVIVKCVRFNVGTGVGYWKTY